MIGEHNSDPWFQLVCDVLKIYCQSLSKSDRVITRKLLVWDNTSRKNAERCVTSFELDTRDVLYAKQIERNRLLHIHKYIYIHQILDSCTPHSTHSQQIRPRGIKSQSKRTQYSPTFSFGKDTIDTKSPYRILFDSVRPTDSVIG